MLMRRIVMTLFFSLFFFNGVAITLSSNAFTYIGQPIQSSLQHLILGGYRLYNTLVGRFSKQDSNSPFRGWHLANGYQYAAGNPILFSDKNGHDFTDWYHRPCTLFNCDHTTPMDEPDELINAPLTQPHEFAHPEENIDFRPGPDGLWVIHVSIQGRLDHTITTRADGTATTLYYGANGVVTHAGNAEEAYAFQNQGKTIPLSRLSDIDPITMGEFKVGDRVLLHKIRANENNVEDRYHAFNESAKEWIRNHRTCPLCRETNHTNFEWATIIDG